MRAVSFDFGQTLAELDLAMLARRAAERGAALSIERAALASGGAWKKYDAVKRAGIEHREAWCTFMQTLLSGAGVTRAKTAPAHGDQELAREIAAWLWEEQPRKNLWRKPIEGMFELCAELRTRGIAVGIVSNSEGHVEELAAELGILDSFGVIADSGVLGFEKPDPRIFRWAAERLGTSVSDLVHVGDAWETDVVGALGVGARAVWFSEGDARALPEGVRLARNAAEVRAALAAFDVI